MPVTSQASSATRRRRLIESFCRLSNKRLAEEWGVNATHEAGGHGFDVRSIASDYQFASLP
jgi:hypothetical protein